MNPHPVFTLRRANPEDEPFLWRMLYEAVYTPPGEPRPAREIIRQPALARYVSGWGLSTDLGYLAIQAADHTPTASAWLRLLQGENSGYGHVDDATPELSLAVLPEFRGRGLGTRLLKVLFETAAGCYSAVSLSVDSSNPALRLYQRLGFEEVRREGSSLIMVKALPASSSLI